MEFESGGLSREEIRKKRRQKERKHALLVLGGIAAAVCLVLGIGIAALVHTISSNHAQKQEAAKQAMLEQQAAEKETAAALAEAKKECAHNLCAVGAQIPHWQPELYFLSRTCRERK